MSSDFQNIQKLNTGGHDLTVNLVPAWVFGEKETPIAVSFQVGDSRAMISLEDFCDMFRIYLVRGGLSGWETLPCGIPDPVREVLAEAAERIGR